LRTKASRFLRPLWERPGGGKKREEAAFNLDYLMRSKKERGKKKSSHPIRGRLRNPQALILSEKKNKGKKKKPASTQAKEKKRKKNNKVDLLCTSATWGPLETASSCPPAREKRKRRGKEENRRAFRSASPVSTKGRAAQKGKKRKGPQ